MVGLPCVDTPGDTIEQLKVMEFICHSQSSNILGVSAFSWEAVLAGSILASLMILIFFYLFAVLFRNEKTVAWVHMEMYELISTTIIVIAIVMITQGLCSFNAGWIFSDSQLAKMDVDGLTSSTHIYVMAGTYLKHVTDGITKWMCLDMVGAVLADLGSSEFKIHPMGQGFVTTPMAGFFAPIKLILNNAMIGMLITYVVNEAMFNIFKYSIVAFPMYFLPFGIFFRSFEPTRRFGGTLIALSIAFMIIFPVILSISFYIWDIGLLGGVTGDIADTWWKDIKKTMYESWTQFVGKVGGGLVGAGVVTILLGTVGGALTMVVLFFSAMLSAVGKLFSLVFFFFGGIVVWKIALAGFIIPAFNTMILVYSMRSLGQTLGEPVDITSLTRVI